MATLPVLPGLIFLWQKWMSQSLEIVSTVRCEKVIVEYLFSSQPRRRFVAHQLAN